MFLNFKKQKKIMTRKEKYTTEEIIEEIKKWNNTKEFRDGNRNMYRYAKRKGIVISDYIPCYEPSRRVIYNEEQLINIIKKYNNIKELRENDYSAYIMCRKRGIKVSDYLKGYDLRCGGSSNSIYRFNWSEKLCARCFNIKEKSAVLICKKCKKDVLNKTKIGEDHNLWNVKDDYCNIHIKDLDIKIGIRVDNNTEKLLKEEGYGFIFK